jgi:hypothetical protein
VAVRHVQDAVDVARVLGLWEFRGYVLYAIVLDVREEELVAHDYVINVQNQIFDTHLLVNVWRF